MYGQKRSAPQHKAAADDNTEQLSRQWPYYFGVYSRKPSASSHKSADGSFIKGGHSHMPASYSKSKVNMSAVFFHEQAVKVGQSLPFYFPPAKRAPLGMLQTPSRSPRQRFPASSPGLESLRRSNRRHGGDAEHVRGGASHRRRGQVLRHVTGGPCGGCHDSSRHT